MRKVFNDEVLENKFHKDGYVVVDFISTNEVDKLRSSYDENIHKSGGLISEDDAQVKDKITYDFTFIDKNISYKKEVFSLIVDAFESKVTSYLNHYRPIIANFIRKKTHAGEVPLHQNWAFVDEELYTSVSIWCPLVDSNEENGTLQVVPGSHKKFGKNRGPKIPWELESIKHDIIDNDLVPMNLKAGQAVILDDSIVHYSAINNKQELRLAIQLILVPEEVKSIHYNIDFELNPNQIELLEVEDDFYMEFNPWKKAENVKIVHAIPYKPRALNRKEYLSKLNGDFIDSNNDSLFDKFKSLFK